MFRLITPTQNDQLDAYYQFRWQMLREPWQLPKGAERDAYDIVAHHRMIIDGKNNPVAIGRLYLTPDHDGQIHYMAVKPALRNRGLGALVLMALESLAREEGAKRLVCNVPEDTIGFYLSHGFEHQGGLIDDGSPNPEQQMIKTLEPLVDVIRQPQWCQELQTCWLEKIPISDKMGIRIAQFTGYRFEVSALLNANLNPYDAMFSGSIFSMAALTGWGMVWLLMKERHLEGSIVLAESKIRYQNPIIERPRSVVSLDSLSGDLDRLANGKKARVKLNVDLFSGDEIVGVFNGTYVLVPSEN